MIATIVKSVRQLDNCKEKYRIWDMTNGRKLMSTFILSNSILKNGTIKVVLIVPNQPNLLIIVHTVKSMFKKLLDIS